MLILHCFLLTSLHNQDACQTLLKRLQPIINKNPKGNWNDWVRDVKPPKCVCVLADPVTHVLSSVSLLSLIILKIKALKHVDSENIWNVGAFFGCMQNNP